MKIPLVRGRLLTASDLLRSDPVVVVNEAYAAGWFPGEEAIGKRGGFNQAEIVGIVGDSTITNVRWKEPAVYRLVRPGEARLAPALAFRTASSVEPSSVFKAVEQVVRGVNPRLFVAVRTADEALNPVDRPRAHGRHDERPVRRDRAPAGGCRRVWRRGVGGRATNQRAGPARRPRCQPMERRQGGAARDGPRVCGRVGGGHRRHRRGHTGRRPSDGGTIDRSESHRLDRHCGGLRRDSPGRGPGEPRARAAGARVDPLTAIRGK